MFYLLYNVLFLYLDDFQNSFTSTLSEKKFNKYLIVNCPQSALVKELWWRYGLWQCDSF